MIARPRLAWSEHGLPCLAWRNDLGAWCGYVGVPPAHPIHRRSYHELDHIDAHGGLTFSGSLPDKRADWWVGFDCAHAGDYVPALSQVGGEVRSLDYVRAEVGRLAAQVAAVTDVDA